MKLLPWKTYKILDISTPSLVFLVTLKMMSSRKMHSKRGAPRWLRLWCLGKACWLLKLQYSMLLSGSVGNVWSLADVDSRGDGQILEDRVSVEEVAHEGMSVCLGEVVSGRPSCTSCLPWGKNCIWLYSSIMVILAHHKARNTNWKFWSNEARYIIVRWSLLAILSLTVLCMCVHAHARVCMYVLCMSLSYVWLLEIKTN